MNVYVSHAGASTGGGGIGSFFCWLVFLAFPPKERGRKRGKEKKKKGKEGRFSEKRGTFQL